MTCLLRLGPIIAIAAVVCLLAPKSSLADEPATTAQALAETQAKTPTPNLAPAQVTVKAKSGRQFSGVVDRRTDATSLWLRVDGRATIVRRPIDWSRIVSVRYEGRDLSPAEFQPLAVTLGKSAVEPNAWASNVPSEANSSPPTYAELARRALADSPHVASIEVNAHAANWDADIETDGILLRVVALDSEGNPTAVKATLEVELVATRPVAMTTRSYARGRDLGKPFVRIGRWTRDFDTTGGKTTTAVFRLPFAAAAPDVDLELGDIGLATATLAVPGEGVFHASDDHVTLRHFNSLRNQRERRDGARFFPIERPGRNQ